MKIRVISKGEKGTTKGYYDVVEIIGAKHVVTFKYKNGYAEAFNASDIINPGNSKIQLHDGNWRSMTLEEFKELLA